MRFIVEIYRMLILGILAVAINGASYLFFKVLQAPELPSGMSALVLVAASSPISFIFPSSCTWLTNPETITQISICSWKSSKPIPYPIFGLPPISPTIDPPLDKRRSTARSFQFTSRTKILQCKGTKGYGILMSKHSLITTTSLFHVLHPKMVN